MAFLVYRNMSDAGSDDLDEERVQDLGVSRCILQYLVLSAFFDNQAGSDNLRIAANRETVSS